VLLLLLLVLFSLTLSIQQDIMLFDRPAISVHFKSKEDQLSSLLKATKYHFNIFPGKPG